MTRHTILALLVLAAASVGCISMEGSLTVTAPESKEPVLQHVVLFKFKDTATPEDVREIEQSFAALEQRIDAIKAFQWGTDVSVENLAKGFTHCFIVTFENEAGRDEYLPHPAHKEFVELVGPHLEEVLVIDYRPRT